MCLFLSCVRLFATPWTVACQAALSMGFSRQEYWSGLPFPTPGDLPDPGIEPPTPALAGRFFTAKPPGKQAELQLTSFLKTDYFFCCFFVKRFRNFFCGTQMKTT